MLACSATDDFCRSRNDHMIDLRHPLTVLASRMSWQSIEASVAHLRSLKAHAGQDLPDLDLFGEASTPRLASPTPGRPRVPLRTMIALLYFKHAFDLSDEALVQRWSDSPNFQFFSGQSYFEPRLHCEASTLVKFRRLLGEEAVEELLAQTVNLAVSSKLIPAAALASVVVDSTEQEKAVAHLTHSKLLETARGKLVQATQSAGIELKQTFAKEGNLLRFKPGRYAHARHFKRMRRVIKRQRTIVGRLQCEIDRKANAIGQAVREVLAQSLNKAQRIFAQSGQRKAVDGQPKLYAWHAPEVECIAKGKSRTPYESGVKVGIAMTLQHNLIVGARAFVGSPYDGHTLCEQLEPAATLMQDTGDKPMTECVDLGHRGVDADNLGVAIKRQGNYKALTAQERKLLKRRQAIEPNIWQLKSETRMDRCYLKAEQGETGCMRCCVRRATTSDGCCT